jgi:hypothetical protein
MLVAMSVLLLAACGVETPEGETETREVVPEPSVASATGSTRPQGLGSTNKVLILASTVVGAESSVEALAAKALGYTVELATADAWRKKTSADFATYRAIIMGDPNCTYYSPMPLAEAVKNRNVWGPVVDGNVIIIGTDPVAHGKNVVTRNAVRFATAEAGKTGFYISLSCYYHETEPTTPVPVPVLAPFGAFSVTGVGCYNDAHMVAEHTALSGMTDSLFSNWSCSVHEAFHSYPAANFAPLVIARDNPKEGEASLPGSREFADGTRGVPYVLARGAKPVLCGDGIKQAAEECDTGTSNGVPGTLCSSVCRLHWCGNGVVDQGEDCDLGAGNGSATCSSSCQGTVVSNRPPVARCKSLSLSADATCRASASVNDGSSDPDGDLVGCTQTPVGTFDLGSTLVTLTCTDATGQTASCTSTVTVTDTVLPTLTCPANLSAECVAGGATVDVPLSSGSDACGVDVTGPHGAVAFSPGTTSVRHEARDSSGNVASCTFDVTVADTQAPVVALNGAAAVTLECRKPYDEAGVTASDACSGDLSGAVRVSGSVDTRLPGTYTLTYSVTDGAGLVGSATRTVTVVPGASGTCQAGGGGWLSTGSLALPRMLHTATLLDDGRVLVAGGFNVTSELYDPGTRTWSATGNNLGTRRYHTATKLKTGEVLIAGGGASSLTHVTAELYAPTLGTWRSAGALNVLRYHHTALLLPDGKVLVAGGSPSESEGGALASAELYDPATNTWSFTGGLNVARRDHSMTWLPNGKVLVAGGIDAADGFLSSAELYDPATGTWTLVAGMSTARASHTATRLGDGKVLMVGGSESDPVRGASAELYDPATGTWSTTGGMTSPRRWHTADVLPDGRVLVAGGYHDYVGIQFAAELYDPATGTWSTTEAMRTDRYKHASVVLGDTVLIMGGVSNNDNAAAEYFDPNAL